MSVEYSKDESIPAPIRYIDYEGFWKGVDDHKLMLQKCGACDTWCHLPQPMCPECQSLDRKWEAVSGKGTVYSWVTHRESNHPAFKAPYSVVLVELEEGMRIISNLVDVKPEDIRIGMKVTVTFDKITDGFTLPKFKKV